jgi:polyphosphate glucokinase
VGFGVDIGGSGIKGGQADLDTGELVGDRVKILTPQPATIASVVDVVREVVELDGWTGALGCTFPGVVRHGIIHTAANMGSHWIGSHLEELIHDATGRDVAVLNDADAAGVAEMHFGVGRGRGGVVIMTTLGTGIGSAVFLDGQLLPNTELGHLELDGKAAERRAAASVRERKNLSWEEWATRLQRYYRHLELLFSPDLFIVGGGVSRKSEKFLPMLALDTEIVPATLENQAGIVGAAMAARERFGH